MWLIARLISPGAPPVLADLVRSRSDASARDTCGTCGGDLELPKVRNKRGKRTYISVQSCDYVECAQGLPAILDLGPNDNILDSFMSLCVGMYLFY